MRDVRSPEGFDDVGGHAVGLLGVDWIEGSLPREIGGVEDADDGDVVLCAGKAGRLFAGGDFFFGDGVLNRIATNRYHTILIGKASHVKASTLGSPV